jgi:hypothetical protein
MTNVPQDVVFAAPVVASALILPESTSSVPGLLCRGPTQDGLTALLLEEFDLALPDDVPYLLCQAPLIASHILRYLEAVEKK